MSIGSIVYKIARYGILSLLLLYVYAILIQIAIGSIKEKIRGVDLGFSSLLDQL